MSDEQNKPDDTLAELQRKFDEAQAALVETRKQLETVERRQKIDAALVEADAVDLESARLLTEVAVGLMDDADVQTAVDDLRRRKPFLFRRSPGREVGVGGAMSPRPRRANAPAEDAARDAAATGNRRDLLRYLRMRRCKQN